MTQSERPSTVADDADAAREAARLINGSEPPEWMARVIAAYLPDLRDWLAGERVMPKRGELKGELLEVGKLAKDLAKKLRKSETARHIVQAETGDNTSEDHLAVEHLRAMLIPLFRKASDGLYLPPWLEKIADRAKTAAAALKGQGGPQRARSMHAGKPAAVSLSARQATAVLILEAWRSVHDGQEPSEGKASASADIVWTAIGGDAGGAAPAWRSALERARHVRRSDGTVSADFAEAWRRKVRADFAYERDTAPSVRSWRSFQLSTHLFRQKIWSWVLASSSGMGAVDRRPM